MADTKFSQFTSKPSPVDADEVVGIASGANVRIPVSAFATGAEGALAATASQPGHTHTQSDVTNLTSDLALKAPLASPAFTGNPTAPTPSTADNDTSIATTAHVQANAALKVTANAGITGATKTKITYDAKGLVTSGADAAIADITGLQGALDAKQNDIILTTSGTSGAATLVGDTLNIPVYSVGGGSNGHVIEDEGTPLTQRANLNFVGAGVTVTDDGTDTLVTISGGGGAPSFYGLGEWEMLNFTGTGSTTNAKVIFNNTAFASVTQIKINYSNKANTVVSGLMVEWAVGDIVSLQNVLNPQNACFYKITENVSPDIGGTEITLNVSYVYHDGVPFTVGTDVMLGVQTSGDQTSIVGITGTKAQFDTALTDDNFAYTTDLNTKVSALGNRAANEGVLIICLGDSNMTGGTGAANLTLQSPNTNILVRASGGYGAAQDPATNVSWINVNPNDATTTDLQTGGGLPPYWGLRRGGRGTADWALADKIQKELECPVWLITVATGATTSNYWLETGGQGMDQLQTYLSPAISQITPPAGWVAPTKAHVVMWSEGANDVTGGFGGPANKVAPQDFVTNMKAIRDYMLAQGWTSKETLTLNMNMSPTWPNNLNNQWPGINYLDNQTDEYYRILSSRDKEVEADQLHFSPVGLNSFGLNAAEIALKGLQPKVYTAQGANNFEYSGLGVYSYTGTAVDLGTTAGVVAPAYLDMTKDHTWSGNNGAASLGLDLPAGLLFGGTQTLADSTTPFPTGGILSNQAIFSNSAGVAKNYSAYPNIISNVKYRADGAALNATGNIMDLYVNPSFQARNGGSMVASSTGLDIRAYLGEATAGINQGLINCPQRYGINITSAVRSADSATGSVTPTIGVQSAIVLPTLSGAANNAGINIGGGAFLGSWGLVQSDTSSVKFNAGIHRRIRENTNATALPILRTDNQIVLRVGSSGVITLPTAEQMSAGFAEPVALSAWSYTGTQTAGGGQPEPPAGEFKTNSATLASITEIDIDDTDVYGVSKAAGAGNMDAWVVGGRIKITQGTTTATYTIDAIDRTGTHQRLTVTLVSGTTSGTTLVTTAGLNTTVISYTITGFTAANGWFVDVINWRAGAATISLGTGTTFENSGIQSSIATGETRTYVYLATSMTEGVWV